MQRHEMIDAMRGLGLKGMAGAFDETVTAGVQRQRTAMEILTDLLRAEAAHRHAASIRYRMSAAKLPVVKDIDAFVFDGTPINEGLVRSLHSGSFLSAKRNMSGARAYDRAACRRRAWPEHARRGAGGGESPAYGRSRSSACSAGSWAWSFLRPSESSQSFCRSERSQRSSSATRRTCDAGTMSARLRRSPQS